MKKKATKKPRTLTKWSAAVKAWRRWVLRHGVTEAGALWIAGYKAGVKSKRK